jgi:hypothetical protein
MNDQLTTLLQSQAPDAFRQYVNCQLIDEGAYIGCSVVAFLVFLGLALWARHTAKTEEYGSDKLAMNTFASLGGVAALFVLGILLCSIVNLIELSTNPKGYLLGQAVEKVQ